MPSALSLRSVVSAAEIYWPMQDARLQVARRTGWQSAGIQARAVRARNAGGPVDDSEASRIFDAALMLRLVC